MDGLQRFWIGSHADDDTLVKGYIERDPLNPGHAPVTNRSGNTTSTISDDLLDTDDIDEIRKATGIEFIVCSVAPCTAIEASMARATDRTSFKREAERRYPHKVDIPVPGSGLGRRLTDMHEWCAANVAAGEWAEHGHSERRKGERPMDFAWFYFMRESDADAFQRA